MTWLRFEQLLAQVQRRQIPAVELGLTAERAPPGAVRAMGAVWEAAPAIGFSWWRGCPALSSPAAGNQVQISAFWVTQNGLICTWLLAEPARTA